MRTLVLKQKALAHLTREGVVEALENGGYSDSEFTEVQFKGVTEKGQAIYEVRYYDNNTGLIDKGNVYVWEEDGLLKADY